MDASVGCVCRHPRHERATNAWICASGTNSDCGRDGRHDDGEVARRRKRVDFAQIVSLVTVDAGMPSYAYSDGLTMATRGSMD